MIDTAFVTPELITWARTRAGVSIDHLAGMLKTDPRTVAAWEGGTQSPPFGKAETLAEKLHVPFGFLFLSNPPIDEIPLPDLRTVGDVNPPKPSLDFMELVTNTVLKQQWYSEYAQERGAQRLTFIGSCRITDGFQEVASTIAFSLGIDDEARKGAETWEAFLRFIIRNAEDLGVLVMQRGIVGNYTKRRLSVDEFRGFAIADRFAPLVFINSRDSKAAKNFTVIHELCHLWMGESGISNPQLRSRSVEEKNEVEVFCNRVAAEVLVPHGDLLNRWLPNAALEMNVTNLARHFKASRYVVLRQAYQWNKITYPQFSAYLNTHPSLWRPSEGPDENADGGNFFNTLVSRTGKRFLNGVLGALNQSKVSYRDAAALLDIKIPTLKKIAERLG